MVMGRLTAGQKALDFHLSDQDGKTVTLAEFIGKWVLVYFYPKDDTPGCTKEACGIRDSFAQFKRAGIVVLGISVDGVASHRKFVDKFSLPFTLLADEKKDVVSAYGVWGKKKFMGKEFMGTLRTSFLINPSGAIAKIYEQVKPEEHAAEVLADVKASEKK